MRPYSRPGAPPRGDQIACDGLGYPVPVSGSRESPAWRPREATPAAWRRRGGRSQGSHSPGPAQGPRERFRLAGAERPRPAPGPAPQQLRPARAPGPRPPTWLSPTQKTRPPRLRHTRASRGRAAAPQKVKEQREARSRCTVVRTSAAGRRPQRTHRYR